MFPKHSGILETFERGLLTSKGPPLKNSQKGVILHLFFKKLFEKCVPIICWEYVFYSTSLSTLVTNFYTVSIQIYNQFLFFVKAKAVVEVN